jgi:hypothetical protein
MTPGDTVRYYRNGERYGVLVEINAKFARIRPIGPHKRCVTVPVGDVEKAEVK